jgi:hypothetical protein
MAKKTKAKKSGTKNPSPLPSPAGGEGAKAENGPASGEPKANSPADIGYGPPPPDDYSPAQRTAFREAFRQIGAIEAKRLDCRAELSAAEEQLSGAKDDVKICQDAVKVLDSDIEELFIHLQAIDKGTWDQKLPGMDGAPLTPPSPAGGEGANESGADPIPPDMLRDAENHVITSRAKGKGLDVASLSLVLFGDRKKEHKPRCEQILEQLAARGLIVADVSDEKKVRWLPAEKE